MFVAVLLSVSMLSPNVIASTSDEGYLAQAGDVSVSPSVTDISINAGESVTMFLDIKNKLTDPDKTLIVYVYHDDSKSEHIEVSFPEGNRIEVKPGAVDSCKVLITVSDFADTDNYNLSFDIMINDPDRGSPIRAEASDIFTISVKSNISGDGFKNKFLGIWENNLPGVLGTSAFAAAVTLVMVLCIAYIIGLWLIPRLERTFRGGDSR